MVEIWTFEAPASLAQLVDSTCVPASSLSCCGSSGGFDTGPNGWCVTVTGDCPQYNGTYWVPAFGGVFPGTPVSGGYTYYKPGKRLFLSLDGSGVGHAQVVFADNTGGSSGTFDNVITTSETEDLTTPFTVSGMTGCGDAASPLVNVQAVVTPGRNGVCTGSSGGVSGDTAMIATLAIRGGGLVSEQCVGEYPCCVEQYYVNPTITESCAKTATCDGRLPGVLYMAYRVVGRIYGSGVVPLVWSDALNIYGSPPGWGDGTGFPKLIQTTATGPFNNFYNLPPPPSPSAYPLEVYVALGCGAPEQADFLVGVIDPQSNAYPDLSVAGFVNSVFRTGLYLNPDPSSVAYRPNCDPLNLGPVCWFWPGVVGDVWGRLAFAESPDAALRQLDSFYPVFGDSRDIGYCQGGDAVTAGSGGSGGIGFGNVRRALVALPDGIRVIAKRCVPVSMMTCCPGSGA